MLTKRNVILICVSAGLCLLAIVALWLGLPSYLSSLRTKAQLEKEFLELPIPPGITIEHHSATAKTTRGNVESSFNGNLSYEQVRAHYDTELGRRGWVFREQNPLKTFGKDLAQSETIYCRGDRAAIIFWTGALHRDVGFLYGLSFSWGYGRCG